MYPVHIHTIKYKEKTFEQSIMEMFEPWPLECLPERSEVWCCCPWPLWGRMLSLEALTASHTLLKIYHCSFLLYSIQEKRKTVRQRYKTSLITYWQTNRYNERQIQTYTDIGTYSYTDIYRQTNWKKDGQIERQTKLTDRQTEM